MSEKPLLSSVWTGSDIPWCHEWSLRPDNGESLGFILCRVRHRITVRHIIVELIWMFSNCFANLYSALNSCNSIWQVNRTRVSLYNNPSGNSADLIAKKYDVHVTGLVAALIIRSRPGKRCDWYIWLRFVFLVFVFSLALIVTPCDRHRSDVKFQDYNNVYEIRFPAGRAFPSSNTRIRYLISLFVLFLPATRD